jgi:photosystem II stability/assembly factor-like uncharacterized protein
MTLAARAVLAFLSPLMFAAPAGAGLNIWTTTGPEAQECTVKSLSIDPGNPSILYAGTSLGQVFKTADGAESWELMVSDLPVLMRITGDIPAVRVAVDPQNSETLYAATAAGVYRSFDGGAIWEDSSTGLPPQVFVGEIVVDPLNSSTLYAAVSPGGVFKSVNAAQTWTPLPGQLDASGVVGLTIDPAEPATLYARALRNAAIVYFKTVTGGEFWERLENLPTGEGNLVVSPADPEVLYASVSSGIYRSQNAGASWDMASPATGRIAIDPTRVDILYVGSTTGVRRLVDFGTRGIFLSNGLPAGPLVYDVAVDPAVPTRLYAATRLGVYRIDQTPDVCGNFAIDAGEECDLGDLNGTEGACCTENCGIDDGMCDPCQSCLSGGCGGSACTPGPGPSPTPTETGGTATPAPPGCAGDCDLDGAATVDELVTIVNIALGFRPIGDCLAADLNGDSRVTVDEIVTTVQNALNGCAA